MSYSTIALAENIRRNLKNLHKLFEPYDNNNSAILDYINHIDAIAQQIIVDEERERVDYE